ncbi:hypothetical protein BC629DRAFT_1497899 [Irpex lacteus]|nr:hypothetical protein BC629DRAFT_1497899 [Irpex lacteus]
MAHSVPRCAIILQTTAITYSFKPLWSLSGRFSISRYVHMVEGYLTRVLETAHLALCIHLLYEYLVTAWGNLLAAARIIPTVAALLYIEVIIISLVQGWYIYRIWRRESSLTCLSSHFPYKLHPRIVRKQIIPVAFLCALCCVCIGLSFRETAYICSYDLWLEVYGSKQMLKELNVTYGVSVVLEVSITSMLTFYLLQDRSKIAKQRIRKMIMSLVNFALSSGILIALTYCGILISLNISRESITFGGVAQFMTKLHANSMLAALNARQAVINASTSDTMFGVELSHLQSSSTPSSENKPIPSVRIQKHTNTTNSAEYTWPRADKEHDDYRPSPRSHGAHEEV